MATQPDYPLLTAEEFLRFDFGDLKAELDNGVIRMMAGGSRRHARVQSNIIIALGPKLRGSGCAPYGPYMAARTRERSIRYPDVSVYCGHEEREDDGQLSADDPRVVFEVLSAGTARTDLRVKLEEYKELDSIDTVVFVDIANEQLRVVQRIAPKGWSDVTYQEATCLKLPSLGIDLDHDEIFARD
ncbi:Uma2 family endonuclease [Sphingomonas sp. PB4P5]|uniref:Uma2 family endonuclease n=1 Tax=Parasphingomonas puruogangriensis TaxID=3096155 RepID=UPI002FCB3B5A